MKERNQNEQAGIADRVYEPEDYQKKDQVSSGLATTHEQVSDTFTEGEIHAVLDDVSGEDIEIPRKGYDE
ncbi:YozQ family protein [Bacillus massilinigeriensis]|uniref:YozQ family protein n=1 Tax=Bacillus massilionigeriensis TaxID=1805475 RepID=UPI00096AE502|nr:YozQ family protein [Bacillus massilionigeriensis]